MTFEHSKFPNLFGHPVAWTHETLFCLRAEEWMERRRIGDLARLCEGTQPSLATFGERNEMARLNCHALKNE